MYRMKKLEFWLVITVVVLFATGFSSAATITNSKYKAVSNSLSSHIKKDTADKSVTVEITRVAEMEMSKNKQTIFGDAYYVSDNTEKTPIYFEAIVNTLNNKVSVVDYTFVENSSEINTNFLQKLLIKQIGNDHNTKEVAVAMDNVEKIKEIGEIEKFRGYGEVRIGSLIWKKIKFEISLDADSERVLYKLFQM